MAVGRIRWGRYARWVQRLLAVYHWDADQVRDDLQGYVMELWAIPEGCW